MTLLSSSLFSFLNILIGGAILPGQENTTPNDYDENSLISRSLDVRWPLAKLSFSSDTLETYPDHSVIATLEYFEAKCFPVDKNNKERAIPEFFLALHYCGDSIVNCEINSNQNNTQLLYSEKVRGFPKHREVKLHCHLFGIAGYYALFLKSTSPSIDLPYTPAYLKVNWSDKFVFNVHATSILPCDVHGGGVPVLFEYPSCIRNMGDKIRLYGKLRANVASLDPPTTLEYISERGVIRGQHSLYFECDLFTERYVEYCFVYVSKAITGTMNNIRIDCVPTLPVTDQESGGWGPWSYWTPCTSTCFGGIRSRYRFCDSPPPRYGAKFCAGSAIETEKCGIAFSSNWECLYGESMDFIKDAVAEIPEVQAEVGSYCRCGCVVHLGIAKQTRLLATSSQSCPGRNFWLIQADLNSIIQFQVLQFHLVCRNQALNIRDGNALSSSLLAQLSSLSDYVSLSVNSTGSNLLLEFFSADTDDLANICSGGFIAQATQIRLTSINITVVPVTQNIEVNPVIVLRISAVHIASVFFLGGLLLATIILGIQYICRYQKYQIAEADDQDCVSNYSGYEVPLATRVSSSATLLSEVISLTKFRPHFKMRSKHVRLRESIDCDTLKEKEAVALAKEESLSTSSSQDEVSIQAVSTDKMIEKDNSLTTSHCFLPLKRSLTNENDKDNLDEKDNSDEKDTSCKKYMETDPTRRPSNISNIALTNVSLLSKIHSTSDPGFFTSGRPSINKATIKITSVKESKEIKNREKLLAGPTGSDFSIAAQDNDLELDYYDYNVVNAGAAPGSYLGMDPAFLVWIPPLDEDGELFPGNEKQEYHEMMIVREYADPGSNKESPEDEILPRSPRKINKFKESPISNMKFKSSNSIPQPENKGEINNKSISKVQPVVHKIIVDSDLPGLSKKKKETKYIREDMEKETEVEKSLDIDNIENIKFVDDEEVPDYSLYRCNMDLAYRDRNAKSSG